MWLPSVIPWVSCFSDLNQQLNVTFECANLTVPIDYLATSGNGTTQIGIVKARPYGITQPSGILFYQSSEAYPIFYQANRIGTLLSMTNREYDIILVDPRGSGWSNPVTCGYTSETFEIVGEEYHDAIRKIDSVESPLSPECIAKIIAADAILGVQNCTQNEDPQYLAHLNAPNIARDLDLIRNLSGFDTLSLYGEDYGSVIGITYANLFPNQVGHMVLDWVRDFEAWMGINGNFLDYSFKMFSNIEDITYQFANYCLAAYEIDSKYCPLAGPSINSLDPVTDIVNRMNAANDYLSKNADGVHTSGTDGQWTFIDVASALTSNLGNPFLMWKWAQDYLGIEASIPNLGSSSRIKRQVSSNSNLSYASVRTDIQNSFGGELAATIIDCLDSSFIGIDDPDSFSSYVLKQIEINPLAAYQGLFWDSGDITCPNLTLYNPEKLPSQFSSNIRNQIIIIAQTHTLGSPMSAAINTYNFVGSENAVVFVHDVIAYSPMVNGDPDNCTMNVMKAYFIEDQIPENGTVCHTDYSGMNNVFIHYYLDISLPDDGKKKLRICLGVGLGFMGLISLIILAGYWNLRRKWRQKMAYGGGSSKAIKLEETELDDLR